MQRIYFHNNLVICNPGSGSYSCFDSLGRFFFNVILFPLQYRVGFFIAGVDLAWRTSWSLPDSRIAFHHELHSACRLRMFSHPAKILSLWDSGHFNTETRVFISGHGPAVSVHAEAASSRATTLRSITSHPDLHVWFYGRLRTLPTSYGSYYYTRVMYRDGLGPLAWTQFVFGSLFEWDFKLRILMSGRLNFSYMILHRHSVYSERVAWADLPSFLHFMFHRGWANTSVRISLPFILWFIPEVSTYSRNEQDAAGDVAWCVELA